MQIKKTHYQIGKITQPHGLKGHVLLYVYSQNFDWLDAVDGFYLEDGEKLLIESAQVYKKGLRVLFKDVNDRNKAELLKQKLVFIDKSHLKSNPGEDIFFNEVLGFIVTDKTLGQIGKVENFEHHPSNDLLVLRYNEKECLIPFVPSFIEKIDFENKIIFMDLPEGLLEL